MAKKKKPAANPARGFATTSIASKPKAIEKKAEEGETPTEAKDTNEAPESKTQSKFPTSEEPKAKELHELSPEELTEQLERNELQQLLEKHGSKVRREISRLDSKLRTDSRVLRGQAQHISLKKWLPQELVNEILDLMKKEKQDAGQTAKQQNSSKALSEEDTVIRCWTLMETLHDFGIAEDDITKAIGALLKNPPSPDSGSYIWGFKESLDYLSLELDEKNLPNYEQRRARGPLISADASSTQHTASNTPFGSGAVTPVDSSQFVNHT